MTVQQATVTAINTASNIADIKAIEQALATSQPIGHKSEVVTKRQASGTNKLAVKDREAAKVDAKNAILGHSMMQIGEAIGYYSIEQAIAQTDVITTITELLKLAMKNGLEVGMLKASTKNSPRECYDCLVNALQGVRSEVEMKPISDATRDNYLSRIRAYVRDRGANPLDLFGNLATKAKKAAEAAKSTAPEAGDASEDIEVADDVDTKDVSQRQLVAAKGLPSLHAFLKEWITQNDVGIVAEKYRLMVQDVIGQIEVVLPKELK